MSKACRSSKRDDLGQVLHHPARLHLNTFVLAIGFLLHVLCVTGSVAFKSQHEHIIYIFLDLSLPACSIFILSKLQSTKARKR